MNSIKKACKTCGKSIDQAHIARHQASHKPNFRCDYCHMVFTRKDNYKHHLERHGNIPDTVQQITIEDIVPSEDIPDTMQQQITINDSVPSEDQNAIIALPILNDKSAAISEMVTFQHAEHPDSDLKE